MRSSEINKSFIGSLGTDVRSIEGEIANAPISPQKYRALSGRLDKTLDKLQNVEKTANVFARTQAAQLKEQVVDLYGKLEDGLVEREVTQIQQESTSLKKGRVTLRAIKKLESHIQDLEENHLTAIPHRRIVADAKHALLEAKAKLDGSTVSRHFEFLAGRKEVRFVEEIQLMPGEVEELFDIAKAIYDSDMRQAKMRYNMLPDDHRRRVQKHMQVLTARPFEDRVETMQALIATANELVDNGELYPSKAEIDQLFLGLSQVAASERPDKTASFASDMI